MCNDKFPNAVLNRLPAYLHYVKFLYPADADTVSSGAIAKALQLGEVQVRKDLAMVSGAGKPKIGYVKSELIRHLEDALAISRVVNAVIIGAGHIGKALLFCDNFDEYGVRILAAFDENPSVTAESEKILPITEFDDFCAQNDIGIGIIAVPENQAQSVCDKMVANGIRAIWNFAPLILTVPDGVVVKNENLASSVAVLAVTSNNKWRS